MRTVCRPGRKVLVLNTEIRFSAAFDVLMVVEARQRSLAENEYWLIQAGLQVGSAIAAIHISGIQVVNR